MFLNSTDKRYVSKGVKYVPVPSTSKIAGDYYTDAHIDTFVRDHLPLLNELGINAVRISYVDPTQSHKQFMKACADHGIFVMVDVDVDFGPMSNLTYDMALWNKTQSYLDEFMNYPNTLAFVLGHNMLNNPDLLPLARYVKSLVRDAKNYLKQQAYALGRVVPVTHGQTDAGNDAFRLDVMDYLTCGDPSTQVDISSLNVQRWRESSDETTSGYSDLYQTLDLWPVPVLFSEFGVVEGTDGNCPCITRGFQNVYSIFTNGSKVLSGGMINEMIDEHFLAPTKPQAISVNYGVCSISGTSLSKKDDFDNLKTAILYTPWPQLDSNEYYPAGTDNSNKCPSGDEWVDSHSLLPCLPAGCPSPTPGPPPPSGSPTPSGGGGEVAGLSTPEFIGIVACGVSVGAGLIACLACRMKKTRKRGRAATG